MGQSFKTYIPIVLRSKNVMKGIHVSRNANFVDKIFRGLPTSQ